MQVPKYYRDIMSIFDPMTYSNRKIYAEEVKNSLISYEKRNNKFVEFVDYIDKIISEDNSEQFCEEIWKLGGSNLLADPGKYREALRETRDYIANLKL